MSVASEMRHHLVVLQHGNHGAAADMLALENELKAILEIRASAQMEKFHFLRPACSEGLRTHDGIIQLADRVVAELQQYLESSMPAQGEVLVTLIGHSLGGLICRAVARALFEAEGPCSFQASRGGRLVPYSLVALNSPHLGSRRPASMWGVVVNAVVNNTYGRTGRELMLSDSSQPPLLEQMALPGHGYIEVLRAFRHLTLVAAVQDDHAVPVGAASIRWSSRYVKSLTRTEPSPHWRVVGHRGFEPDHVSELFPNVHVPEGFMHGCSPPTEEEAKKLPKVSKTMLGDENGQVVFNVPMLEGLQPLPWRRVEFYYSPGSAMSRLKVHDFTISKKQVHKDLSLEATHLIARMTAMDLLDADASPPS